MAIGVLALVGLSPERVASFDEWIAWLLDTRVTVNDSTFDRNDLTQGIAAALPAGVTVQRVEQVVALALTSRQVIPIIGAAAARAERIQSASHHED